MSKWTPEQFRSAARNIRGLSNLSPSEIESAAQMLEYAAHLAARAEWPSEEDVRIGVVAFNKAFDNTPIDADDYDTRTVRAALESYASRHAPTKD